MSPREVSFRRLFVEASLREGGEVELDRAAANYLLNVLRLSSGAEILAFNGRDGEWRAGIEASGRKAAMLVPTSLLRAQTPRPDLLLLFAPLKHGRLDYMVQKAVEMGAGSIRPVFTARTVPSRINRDRMRANMIEAAEQCGILSVPEVLPEMDLPAALEALEPDRLLVFCDEEAPIGPPVQALTSPGGPGGPVAVLIGPEGGFDPEERASLLRREPIRRISLGPRILRADTAAVAALAVVQVALGDWR
ncbi:16S rRNA (uracil(1498)-N(3))-methyltransferase [uncultured Enterovirga sp.]|uniref:16S rRNA (uracil(1498)-N(3))-methyltransferase n=1 Tax=uncultured Enterovirga sp. TaxID=2026352 RepID=UPI0035CB3F0A